MVRRRRSSAGLGRLSRLRHRRSPFPAARILAHGRNQDRLRYDEVTDLTRSPDPPRLPLSVHRATVPLRISPGRRAQGGTAGDWEHVPHHVLLQHGPMPAAPTRNCAVPWPVWALWCASGPKSCVFSLFPTMKKAAVVCSVTVGFFLSSPCSGLSKLVPCGPS